MLCFFNNKDCNVALYYFSLQIFFNEKKSQLDLYLEEPKLSKKKNFKLEVLSWWKENYNRFPKLSLMAQNLMSILITTVTLESSFCTGKKILIPY